MLSLGNNIPNIQVFVGSFEALSNQYHLQNIYYKEHPLNDGYSGTEEPRDWISTEINGFFPSFFAYWKSLSKELIQKQAHA